MDGKKRGFVLITSLLAVFLCTAGTTTAFLVTRSESIENRFQAAIVACEVEEEFDGEEKTSIVVKNTGTATAYVRVKLVSYRINDRGEHIGGMAEVPAFLPGTGWRADERGYYYYRYPLAPSESEENSETTGNLIAPPGKMVLKLFPEEDGGGRQVVEVIAEAIQSSPMDAVKDAWPEEIIDWLSADMQQEKASDADGM